jgi:hypothetical protein
MVHNRHSCQIDAKTAGSKPKIEFRILIPDERFVVTANSPERSDPHEGVVTMVNPASGRNISMEGAAITKKRVLCCGGRSLKACAADRVHTDDHGVGSGLGLDL